MKFPTIRLTSLAIAVSSLFIAPLFATPLAFANDLVLESQTMDRNADPCKDIFQYSNGKWLTNNPIPADRSRYSAYDEVSERNLSNLKTMVEQLADSSVKTKDGMGSNPQVARLVAKFYRLGMDEAAINTSGISSLKSELAQIDAVANSGDVLKMLSTMHQHEIRAGFAFSIVQDSKNTTRYIPEIAQAGLGLPDRDYYFKVDAKTKEIRTKYLAHVASIFELMGDKPTDAAHHAATVMQMETRLAKVSMDKVHMRDPHATYHLMKVEDLQKLDGNTDWNQYFKDLGLEHAEELNVAQPRFFTEFGKMLKASSLDDWKTYLRWHLLRANAPVLSDAFVNANFEFYGRVLAGTKELQPRWKRVLQAIDRYAGEALGQVYVEKYFGPASKAYALDMVNNIKWAMRERINALDWMSAETKKQALVKLDAITVKIGYPDVWRDYSSLDTNADSYASLVTHAREFEFKRNLAKLGKAIDRNEWDMTPPTVNAYYNPTMNEIVFPAGILQPPLFHVDADAAANYGNTGATIGHELTHAFDDEGRQFDAQGNLKSWWTKTDEQNFLKRASNIEKQFAEFNPIDAMHINGKLTEGENIADLGGLKIALMALHKALATKPEASEIDGLTTDQRFFVAYAQSFRSSARDEQMRLQLSTDPHAPDKYRVLGPLANMGEFSAAFKCTADGSALRAKDKRVDIW